MDDVKDKVRVIACGMIAREILDVCRMNGLDHVSLTCLPADYHHHPEKIAPETDKAIRKARAEGYEHIFIGYADCGTGGMLDKVCAEHGVARIAGPHCFSFYIGNDAFEAGGGTINDGKIRECQPASLDQLKQTLLAAHQAGLASDEWWQLHSEDF